MPIRAVVSPENEIDWLHLHYLIMSEKAGSMRCRFFTGVRRIAGKVIPVSGKTAMYKTCLPGEDPEEQRDTPREYGNRLPVQNR